MTHDLSRESARARRRISDALVRRVAHQGAAVSLNDVAREAEVSKALILYHFADKDALIAHTITALAAKITAREAGALERPESLPLDALWTWLDEELRRGEILILLQLSGSGGERPRAAAAIAAQTRRAAAGATIGRLFGLLQLTPRVPPAMLADVVVAFTDGLALDGSLHDARDPRVAFDVFWLAMLNLAE